ncbi:MAG TPA: zinc ribbon domain-containing protein [Bacillota bacterium]|nr:zinc ribbon domain-containing protein [Bacillota bacterium]
MNKQKIGWTLLLLMLIVAVSPAYAILEVSDQYQFHCSFNDLIEAVTKTMNTMGLKVRDKTVSEVEPYAYYILEEGLRSLPSKRPVYFKLDITKVNDAYQLKVTVGAHGFDYSQKSNNKKFLKEFMGNVQKYVAQPSLDDGVNRCPTCQQPIEPEAKQCPHCHSNLGPLQTPSNIKVLYKQLGEVEVSWSDESDNEEGFSIERKNGNGEYVKIAKVEREIEAYSDQTIETGQIYSYRVRAFNSECNSYYTAEKSIHIP